MQSRHLAHSFPLAPRARDPLSFPLDPDLDIHSHISPLSLCLSLFLSRTRAQTTLNMSRSFVMLGLAAVIAALASVKQVEAGLPLNMTGRKLSGLPLNMTGRKLSGLPST